MCGTASKLVGGLATMTNGLAGALLSGGQSGPSQLATSDPAAKQAEADTKAAQSANAKLAARNRRRGSSLLATGAGDAGVVQPAGGKSVLGA